MKNTIAIDDDFITLGKFLKHINVISSGGMAKWYLSENSVLVDGEAEDRRGRKLYPGMTVEVIDEGKFFIQSAEDKNTSEQEK